MQESWGRNDLWRTSEPIEQLPVGFIGYRENRWNSSDKPLEASEQQKKRKFILLFSLFQKLFT